VTTPAPGQSVTTLPTPTALDAYPTLVENRRSGRGMVLRVDYVARSATVHHANGDMAVYRWDELDNHSCLRE
jgi:hypothetical protein